jgi:hypothetical protein
MNKSFSLNTLDRKLKVLILCFTVTLSIGFYTGLNFVHFTTQGTPTGIEENYLGNEENMEAEVMKFKKSEHEMLNILHTHFLSLSVIFFLLALLVYGCNCPEQLKWTLMTEPLISVFLTFGGIYMLWSGISWMVYIIIISGSLMTLSYTLSILLIWRSIFTSQKTTQS